MEIFVKRASVEERRVRSSMINKILHEKSRRDVIFTAKKSSSKIRAARELNQSVKVFSARNRELFPVNMHYSNDLRNGCLATILLHDTQYYSLLILSALVCNAFKKFRRY